MKDGQVGFVYDRIVRWHILKWISVDFVHFHMFLHPYDVGTGLRKTCFFSIASYNCDSYFFIFGVIDCMFLGNSVFSSDMGKFDVLRNN